MSAWQPIKTAPRDGTRILAICKHDADPYFEECGTRLTDYGARAEGMSYVEGGSHVVLWDESFEITDGWESPSHTMPAWWVLAHDPEVAANPVLWMPIPDEPKES